jgi:hypothetical protein
VVIFAGISLPDVHVCALLHRHGQHQGPHVLRHFAGLQAAAVPESRRAALL